MKIRIDKDIVEIIPEHASEAAELEALKKRVTPGDFVWLKIGYTVRKLKVTGVTDESIYAGNMKFSIKALDDALFTEEPGKEGDAE